MLSELMVFRWESENALLTRTRLGIPFSASSEYVALDEPPWHFQFFSSSIGAHSRQAFLVVKSLKGFSTGPGPSARGNAHDAIREKSRSTLAKPHRISLHISPMPLALHDRAWCLGLLDKLSGFEITQTIFNSTEFRNEAPLRVKTPMTLDIVRQNLNKYESVSDFGRDIELIWFNVKSCFEPESPMFLIALQLEQWFHKRLKKFPKTPMDEWMMQFQKVQKSVRQLLESAPAM
jgi:hypothetical protein